jgi:hypothetical protein
VKMRSGLSNSSSSMRSGAPLTSFHSPTSQCCSSSGLGSLKRGNLGRFP